MRILYSHRIQSRDGQSVHVEELVGALRAAGHEVLVVGPSFYAASSFGGGSNTVARLRRLLPGAAGEMAELAYNVPAYRRLRRAAAKFKPELIYERYNLYYLAGYWLARRTGLPYYLEVNSPLAAERSQFGDLRLKSLAHRLERQVWRGATRALPVTGVLGAIMTAAGVDPARIHVVPNGIVLDRFAATTLVPSADTPSLGFVGFVRDWHGMDDLIRSMAADRTPITLDIVGDGPARPGLETLARDLGIADRVHFTGLIDHHLIPAAVARFDIALQPKVTPYASPLKIFDYMAAARAIVAPDQPNIREVLQHDRTALLFDPAAPGALWTAITTLARDPALRQRLGQAARAELEHRDYTWRGNANRIAAWASQDQGRS
ncbi:MAG: glycosyltransferase family 4 protein [Acetobacteraceae bacterium]